MDIMAELRPIGGLFTAGDFLEGTKKLRDLWDMIPSPKTSTLNAYLVIEYGVAFALKTGDLDEAQHWAELAPEFANVRQDMGEVEFLIGKVAFERGDYVTAKQHLSLADVKSEGRAFQGKDKKYKQLIQ